MKLVQNKSGITVFNCPLCKWRMVASVPGGTIADIALFSEHCSRAHNSKLTIDLVPYAKTKEKV